MGLGCAGRVERKPAQGQVPLERLIAEVWMRIANGLATAIIPDVK